MGTYEKSLRVYDTKKTFLSKIGSTFNRLFEPTRIGINSLIINMKRSALIKNYRKFEKCDESLEEKLETAVDNSYVLYIDSLNELVINNIYKKVTLGTASASEKEALSKYYNIIQIKDSDEKEYEIKKQQYLINLDFNSLKESKKTKVYQDYIPVYLYEQKNLHKALLKHYSMKLTERLTVTEKEGVYSGIFDTLESYVKNIIPLSKITDEELIKECSLYETYEVGKLDQVDILDKNMLLVGISRKIFVHSLPLVVAEKCYIKLLKDTRELIVDTSVPRKRDSAYQLLLRMLENYSTKLLNVKIYWNKNEEKAKYTELMNKLQQLEEVKKEQGNREYEKQKEILFVRADVLKLEEYGDKYYRILQFYRHRLVELGVMKQLKNSYKNKVTRFELGTQNKGVENIEEQASWNHLWKYW